MSVTVPRERPEIRATDADRVTAVLVSGEWYEVQEGTFSVNTDSARIADGPPLEDRFGAPFPTRHRRIPLICYEFRNPDDQLIRGPIEAIEAVRYRAKEDQ